MHCSMVSCSAAAECSCSASATWRGGSRCWLQWSRDARPCYTSSPTSPIVHLDFTFGYYLSQIDYDLRRNSTNSWWSIKLLYEDTSLSYSFIYATNLRLVHPCPVHFFKNEKVEEIFLKKYPNLKPKIREKYMSQLLVLVCEFHQFFFRFFIIKIKDYDKKASRPINYAKIPRLTQRNCTTKMSLFSIFPYITDIQPYIQKTKKMAETICHPR